jgi:hypothetical protein
MSARRISKSEQAAKRKRKEAAARRSIKADILRPIDIWAASIVECFEALVRAGYGEDRARWYIEEQLRLPDWVIQNPNHSPYEDEDEDED